MNREPYYTEMQIPSVAEGEIHAGQRFTNNYCLNGLDLFNGLDLGLFICCYNCAYC